MKALVAHRTTEGLALVRKEVAEPVRGRDDVALVAVEYAAVEAGAFDPRDHRLDGHVVGRGFAGYVIGAAADGSGPQAGERVIGIAPQGGARERLAIRASALVRVPDTLELEEAVLLPVPGLGAYHAIERVGFAYGKRLVVLGAASATGQFACQIGLGSGMRVAALVERERDRRAVTSHGVESVGLWSGHGADTSVAQAPLGVADLVVDASAGRCPACPSLALAADGACVNVSVDELGGVTSSGALPDLLSGDRRARGLAAGGAGFGNAAASALALSRLAATLAAGEIVLPLPVESAEGEVRLPRQAHCIPFDHARR